VTYLTHPSPPLTAVFFTANTTNNTTFRKLFTEFVRIHPHLSDEEYSGFAVTSPGNNLRVVYIGLNITQE
jgi:hypothetical protein